MIDKVYLYKDEKNEIIMSTDGYNSIVIQNIRNVECLGSNSSSELVSTRRQHVILTSIINVDEENFKSKVKEKVEIHLDFLNAINKKEQKIKGVLNDFLSSYREVNGK